LASTSVSPQPKPSIDNMITHILSTKFHTFAIVYGVARHLYHVSAIAFFTLLSTTLRPRPALALPRLSHGQSMAEPRHPALLPLLLPRSQRGLGTVRCTPSPLLRLCIIIGVVVASVSGRTQENTRRRLGWAGLRSRAYLGGVYPCLGVPWKTRGHGYAIFPLRHGLLRT
jgi:hypothetical protein